MVSELDPKIFLFNLLSYHGRVEEKALMPMAREVRDYIAQRIPDVYLALHEIRGTILNNPVLFPREQAKNGRVIIQPNGECRELFWPRNIDEVINYGLDPNLVRILKEAVSLVRPKLSRAHNSLQALACSPCSPP
jgi:hypothetical protein